MKKIFENKKIVYGIAILIIIAGIVCTYVWRTTYSSMYGTHERIELYIGKECKKEDIKPIVEEVFETRDILYQKIETFNEAIAVTVKEASDEQINTLKEKIKEKYELESTDNLAVKTSVGHVRGRDLIKPYIAPMTIVTLIILAYVGIRYFNLGAVKTILTLLIRLLISEAVLLSLFEIIRIPVGIYTIPLGIALYLFITTVTVVGYENQMERKQNKENEKIEK